MIYYKVKPESDQIQYPKNKAGGFLIANELYTEREAEKHSFFGEFLQRHFDKVKISKNNTYWFFGARFISK